MQLMYLSSSSLSFFLGGVSYDHKLVCIRRLIEPARSGITTYLTN